MEFWMDIWDWTLDGLAACNDSKTEIEGFYDLEYTGLGRVGCEGDDGGWQ